MDCRNSLVPALMVLLCSLGCIGTKPWAASDTADGPKKVPQASTCLAFADFKAKEAADPRVAASLVEPMRQQARAAYEQALQIDPQLIPAYVGLARLHSARGDQEHALATYGKALEVNPDTAEVWYEMAMCHLRQREWDHARAHLEKAVALDSRNRQYLTTLGYCLARMGRYEDSLGLFLQVGGKAEAHYKVARMAHHLKHDDVSVELLHRALQENPGYVEARRMLDQLEGNGPGPSNPVMQVSNGTQETGASHGNRGQ